MSSGILARFYQVNFFRIFYSAIILGLSLILFLGSYTKTDSIWDEPYHVAFAEKYINGVFYQEIHPPLGKLLIALGEKIVHPNQTGLKMFRDIADDGTFNGDKNYYEVDYIKNMTLMSYEPLDGFTKKDLSEKEISGGAKQIYTKPIDYSGYRLFPAIFATFVPLLFFWFILFLTRSEHLAASVSALVLFENIFVVHFRAAMLEGIQMFFILSALTLWAYWSGKNKPINIWYYIALGVLIGLAIATKVNALLFVLLPVLWSLRPGILKYGWPKVMKESFYFEKIIREILKIALTLFTAFIVVFIFFSVHFSIARNITNNNYYSMSKEGQKLIEDKKTSNPLYWIVGTVNAFAFIDEYNKKVPAFNPLSETENGSEPYKWILMNKAINYRHSAVPEYDKNGVEIPCEKCETSYSYLLGNPFNWYFGLASVLLMTLLVLISLLSNNIKFKGEWWGKCMIFFILWVGYMLTVLTVHRVLYLYHYFIPLVLSFALGVSLLMLFFEDWVRKESKSFLISIYAFFIISFATFIFFAPLTFGLPLSESAFNMRVWSKEWKLQSVPYDGLKQSDSSNSSSSDDDNASKG
jgi:dolichyl-phosphate-mannose-protein mannosyltransferase